MSFLLSNRALLRGMLTGAMVLTGTACQRSDRTESGRDSSAAVLPDTSNNAAQPSGGGTTTGAVSDSAKTAAPSDKDAVGYRSMERDTTLDTSIGADSAASDVSAEVADTASTEMAGAADTVTRTDVSADTSAAGYAEMARDTSTADQADTAAAANGDVALRATVDSSSQANVAVSAEAGADTTGDAGRIRPPEDSTEILGEVRVRPPEDSTEILGNVTTDEAADETADEQVVRPEDRETVAASEARTNEVGAAAIGGNPTGAEAVALMSREGVRCAVVDPEGNHAVRWDMSNTPVALNPCGMGSMIPSRIWTEGQRDSGTAGQ